MFSILPFLRNPVRLLATVIAFLTLFFHSGAQTINPADYGNITLRLVADTLPYANNASVTAWGRAHGGWDGYADVRRERRAL